MKLRYTMKRSWFTCLDVFRKIEENSWRDEQRFMYLRLRRLVGSVNEHLLEILHYEQLLLQVLLLQNYSLHTYIHKRTETDVVSFKTIRK